MTEGRATLHGASSTLSAAAQPRVTLHGVSTMLQEAVPARCTLHGVSTMIKEPLAAGCATTLANCWEITRQDGTVKRFTTLDRDLVVAGQTYKSCRSVDVTAVEMAASFAAGNMDMVGIIDSPDVTDQNLRAGLYDYAAFRVFKVDWSAPTRGIELVQTGRVGEVRFGKTVYEAQLRSPTQLLQQDMLDVYAPECRWRLGQNFGVSGKAGCKVDLSSLTVSTTVTSVGSRKRFFAAALTQADDWFNYGLVTFTGGANVGQKREVKDFFTSAGTVDLWEQLPFDVAAGDAFTIVPGCDKRKATCIAKFANILNFGGFDFVPGDDSYAQYPDAKGEG